MTKAYAVAYGDPRSGFEYCGPFETYEYAIWWAEDNVGRHNWWVVDMQVPAMEVEELEVLA